MNTNVLTSFARAGLMLLGVTVLYACPIVPPADPTSIGYNADYDNNGDNDNIDRYVSSIVISGNGGLLLFGQTQSLSVLVTYSDGTTSTDVNDVSWYSSDASVVVVTTSGVVTAVGAGSTSVLATAGGANSNGVFFTSEPASVELLCESSVVFGGGSSTYCYLQGKTSGGVASGGVLPANSIVSSNDAVVWVSGNFASAPSGADGVVTLTGTYVPSQGANLTDDFQIEAVSIATVSIDGGSSNLVAGNTFDLTATLTRSSGGSVPSAALDLVQWQTSGALSAAPSTGASTTVTGSAVGQGTVKAVAGAAESSAVVVNVTPASVGISPAGPLEMDEGSELTFSLTAYNTSSQAVSVFSEDYIWNTTGPIDVTSAGPTYATIQATTSGNATIKGTLAGVASSTVNITVNTVSPNPVFEGLVSATVNATTSAQLSWFAASDPQTSSELIVYDIYKTNDGSLAFTAGELHSTTPAGVTQVIVSGLTRGETWTFGVRARDPQGNTDSNTVTRSVFLPRANPPLAETILYVDGGTGHLMYSTTAAPTTTYSLGDIKIGTTNVELTGPRFLTSGSIVGIGQAEGNAQMVYRRDDDGSINVLRTISVNTGTRGVTTAGSATAFGLASPNQTLVAFTESGSSSATVDLWVMTSTGGTPRRLLTDVTRAAPTSNGKIAVIWYDNLYVVSPPANLADSASYPSITPLTTDGGHSSELVFGRNDGSNHTVIAFTPAAGTVSVDVYDIDNLTAVTQSSVDVSGMSALMTGGFVLSTDSGFLTGKLVVQVQSAVDQYHLYAIDLGTSTATNLTPSGGLGKATLDTTRL